MSPLTPEQRATYGRMGAHKIHSLGLTNTGPATAAAMARFERQVDPEGVLEPGERAKRADHARRLYYQQLAQKSARRAVLGGRRDRPRSPERRGRHLR